MIDLIKLWIDIYRHRIFRDGEFLKIHLDDVRREEPSENLPHRNTDQQIAGPGLIEEENIPEEPWDSPFADPEDIPDFGPQAFNRPIKVQVYFESGIDLEMSNEFVYSAIEAEDGRHWSQLLHMSQFVHMESQNKLVGKWFHNRYCGVYYMLLYTPLPSDCSAFSIYNINLPFHTERFNYVKRNKDDLYLFYFTRDDLYP